MTPFPQLLVNQPLLTRILSTATNEFSSVTILSFDLVPGAPPVNVSATNSSTLAIKINWGPIGVELRNGIILGYRIMVGMLNSTLEHTFTASSNQTELLIKNLDKGRTYRISVAGFTSVGNGPQSAPVFIKTDEEGIHLCISIFLSIIF